MLPLICWFGLADPMLIPVLSNVSWDNPWVLATMIITMIILFCAPLGWMLVSGRGDFAAMWLMQNALLAGGYFFLPQTAEALNIPYLAPTILRAGVWIGVINAIGFLVLLPTLGMSYFLARLSGARVKPLPLPARAYDRRIGVMLRLAGVFNVAVIVVGMAAAHTIPMLAADSVAARNDFANNSLTRPFYNASMAILPFVVGGLLVLFSRQPRRWLGFDGWLAALVMLMQLLSGNRFTLAVAVMVAIALLSMERKWPRSWLLAAVAGFIILFVGLSGLTSIWRQNRGALDSGGSLVTASFREAYLGNNLIDYRDAAWVVSEWDHQPLMGVTYMGGLVDMMPSAVFPQKKQWHLGRMALTIVGWGEDEHAGLRLSCFGESYLNFGFTGVVGLALILGILLGWQLRYLHVLGGAGEPCLFRNLSAVMLVQMLLIWTNSSDAYEFWALLLIQLLLLAVKGALHYGSSAMAVFDQGRAA